MSRVPTTAAVALGAMIGLGASLHAQGPRVLDLSFGTDGRVTLSAQHVTVREILAEWARQCGCFVVNADRLTGAPLAVPVTFDKAPQDVVLRSLLRETGGFALTPRRAGSTSASLFETIYIISPSAPAATFSAPAASFTPFTAIRTAPDDEIPPVVPLIVAGDNPTPTGQTPDTQQAPASQAPRPPTIGGFTITPVTPVASPSTGPAPAPAGAPGRVTPGPTQP